MRPQILIGLYTEGPTDVRFLTSVVKRTFEDISFDCQGEFEILDIQHIAIHKSTFAEDIVHASKKGIADFGITVLCIHSDADGANDANCFDNKINPAILALEAENNDCCKIIVPLVPIQMTEAWMLADKELLKREIGTNKSDLELEIHKNPEHYANPKEVIESAIRIAYWEKRKRQRRELNIADLYLTIGQSIDLKKLKRLSSYNKFRTNVRNAFVKLNYLY